MHTPTALGAAALVAALAALTVAALFTVGARRSPVDVRRPHRWFVVGALLMAVAAGVTEPVVRLVAPGWAGGPADNTASVLIVFGAWTACVAVATVALLTGLFALPGLAASGRVLLRHLLDALVIAAALCFTGGVLVSAPTRLLGAATPPTCRVVLGGSSFTALAIGLAVIAACRVAAPRWAVARVVGSLALTSAAGAGLPTALRCAWPPVAWLCVVTLPVGLALLCWSVRSFAVARSRAGAEAGPAPRPAGPRPDGPGAADPATAGPAEGGWPGDDDPAEGGWLDGDEAGADAPTPADAWRTGQDSLRVSAAVTFLPVGAISGAAAYQLVQGGTLNAYHLGAGIVAGYAIVVRLFLALLDVRRFTQRVVRREVHFRKLAHTDPLTGLPNRRGLLSTLARKAVDGPPCVLLALDLDGFKAINDMRGHDVGDAVLTEIGRRLRGNLRPGDLAARLGGDEFAVLMWTRPDEALPIAERLLRVLSSPYQQPTGTVFLSASIGLAACTGSGDVPSLMRNADLALRSAKQHGKSRVEQYDAGYERRLLRRTTVTHELRGAIDRDELRLVYQPVVVLPSVRTAGAEALLRWRHPRLGAVPPDEFIPLAEECGMIARLGAWVLHQACHQLSLWLSAGHDVWVSVNASPYELHSAEYVEQVSDVLRAHRVPPQRLVLEVTEHAVAPDLDELVRRLTALRATGVRIALDDFGAGYNSLAQLRNLPVDILKIDHSLVAELDPSRGRGASPLVDVVAEIGHRLGVEVIAEGVTVPEQRDLVVDAGCRFAQGQLFGWAVPAEHLEARLAASGPDAAARRLVLPTQHVGSVDSGREMRQA